MKIAVLPEPNDVVLGALRVLAPDARIFAPWAIRGWHAVGPVALQRFVARRRVSDSETASIPGWPLLEAAQRLWGRGRTDRRYRGLFATRQLVARLASLWLKTQQNVEEVLAPSLAGRELFASFSGTKTLIEDLPAIRPLHADLERAAERHPGCQFLRRFRAPDACIVRQESEWILCDRIAVRGRQALARHHGREVKVLTALGADPAARAADSARLQARFGRGPLVALAGLAAARHGSCEALAVLAEIPWLRLQVRSGEGAEPAALLAHPRVVVSDQPGLGDAAMVIAPAWVECYPSELSRAAAAGLPIIATARASGHIDRMAVSEIEPGDVRGLAARISAHFAERLDQHAPAL